MQPGRKRRLAAKRRNLAKQLQERFLSQVFGFRRICRHPQTQRIHAAFMQAVQKLKSFCIALLGSLNRLCFGKPVAL